MIFFSFKLMGAALSFRTQKSDFAKERLSEPDCSWDHPHKFLGLVLNGVFAQDPSGFS